MCVCVCVCVCARVAVSYVTCEGRYTSPRAFASSIVHGYTLSSITHMSMYLSTLTPSHQPYVRLLSHPPVDRLESTEGRLLEKEKENEALVLMRTKAQEEAGRGRDERQLLTDQCAKLKQQIDVLEAQQQAAALAREDLEAHIQSKEILLGESAKRTAQDDAAIIHLKARVRRGKPFAATKLDVLVKVGTNELQCNVPAGCMPGMLVVIGEGLDDEEERHISGFASILVDQPLSHTHPVGTTITIYDPNHLSLTSANKSLELRQTTLEG